MTELIAGRELDALVAEKVMGETVRWVRYIEKEDQSEPWEPDWDGTSNFPKECKSTDKGAFPQTRNYSTDISAAKMVQQHFIDLGCQVQINSKGFYSDGRAYCTYEGWYCLIQRCIGGETAALFDMFGECENAETEALAICLAALKVLATA